MNHYILIPMNVNHVGAHAELYPTNPPPEPIHHYKRVGRALHIQRVTFDPTSNIAQPTPLWPPYQTWSEAYDRLQGSTKQPFNGKLIEQA